MRYHYRKGKTATNAIIIIAVIVLAYSFLLLQYNRISTPNDTIEISLHTINAHNGMWEGSITVSEPASLISVIIPTETLELTGNSNINVLQIGTASIIVYFDDLTAGSYILIFTFKITSSGHEVSSDLENVVFK